jgi:hypothetical protein
MANVTNVLAKPLEALMALANLRDDPADFERFAKHWPGLVHVGPDLPNGEAPLQLIGHDDKGDPIIRAGDIWDTMIRVPEFIPPRFAHMYKRRETLRWVWRGNAKLLSALLIPGIPPEEELTGIYASLPKTDLEGRPVLVPGIWAPITFDWQSGRILYSPQTEFQHALYELFKKSPFVKVCANPDCPTPYFIAAKTSQRYCEEKCAAEGLRESKRKSWHENKDKWRPRGRKKRKH